MKLGFTLIEMSIVLVVIGLIIGGILTGEDLIRSAKAQTVITEREQYETAAMTFRNKYGWMPGDFPNAVGMLASANAGNSSDNYTYSCYSPNTSPGTCNGNGDGYIGLPTTDPIQGGQGWTVINAGENSGEELIATEGVLFWNHLAFAGLISGTYQPVFKPTGTPLNPSSQGPEEYPGYNVPVSKAYNSAGWSLWNICIQPADGYLGLSGNNTCGQILFYGAETTTIHYNYGDTPLYPILSPQQAQAIDNKIDDGKAMTGKVQTALQGTGFDPACTTTNSAATSQYALSTSGILCSLYFRIF